MPDPQQNIDALAYKFLQGTATPEEEKLLFEWYNAGQDEHILINKEFAGNEEILSARMIEAIRKKISPPVRQYFLPRWGWAAAVLLVLATTTLFWFQNGDLKPLAETSIQILAEVEPGKNGAILTLADGSEIVLDSLGNGIVAAQKGSSVLLDNGRLTYSPSGNAAGEIVYNSLSTPKGRMFTITLSDGTQVWLNAASSLKYPTFFSGKNRQVEVSGEVYFEVAKDKTKPFLVKVADRAEIEVLGTHFNVNAYGDETTINTTLLEGSVRTSALQMGKPGNTVILKPGQQAQLDVAADNKKTEVLKVIENADTDKAMAWRKGFFNFENASLKEVMRQLTRWYDIDVVYEKGVPDIVFGGELSRNVKLSGLLMALKAAKVNFRMEEGRRLIVMP